ncbi:hypothetical protein D6774_00400 [Candidatus Woesearchaeota archaeon]|nr:MAG: hypothetical protein D6774_00400 [Candidatus Woesearchaeota archaeon]
MDWAKIKMGVEEVILLLLIALAIGDFFEVLSVELDFLKKIISWTALGYLFYKASPSRILFGRRKKRLDVHIIFANFLLILKNLSGFSSVALKELAHDASSSNLLREGVAQFLILFHKHAATIELLGLYIGFLWLLCISARLAPKKLGENSLIGVVHEAQKPSKKHTFARFVIIYLVLLSFFIIVFNLAMEWLTIAVDATFAVAGIFFYLFFWVKHYKKFNTYSFIYKVGNMGEEFYEKFITLFKSRSTLVLGIVGMLVLHILTDVANFLIPYTLGLRDALYFEQLPAQGHTPLFLIVLSSTQNPLLLTLTLLLNVIAVYLLFLGPAYIWRFLYKRGTLDVNPLLKAVFFASVSVFFLSPAFAFQRVAHPTLALLGVDILTQEPHASMFTLLYALLIGVLTFILAKMWPRLIRFVTFALVQGFFLYYIGLYFLDISSFYVTLLRSIPLAHFFLTLHFALFFIITTLFYVGGALLFVWEVWQKQHV